LGLDAGPLPERTGSRAWQPAPGKDHARIIDFMDSRVGVLAAGARSRAYTFSRMPGVSIQGEE